jgi:hypothetical protein
MASVKIVESLNKLKSLKSSSYPIFNIKKSRQVTKVEPVLPFRIKFVNIGVPAYGPGNVPPIGIAVIGINNYIL